MIKDSRFYFYCTGKPIGFFITPRFSNNEKSGGQE